MAGFMLLMLDELLQLLSTSSESDSAESLPSPLFTSTLHFAKTATEASHDFRDAFFSAISGLPAAKAFQLQLADPEKFTLLSIF